MMVLTAVARMANDYNPLCNKSVMDYKAIKCSLKIFLFESKLA